LPLCAFSVNLRNVVVLMPDPLDDLFARYGITMSVEECADLLGIRSQQVRRRLRLTKTDPRRIPGWQPGGSGKWIIPTAALRDYVETGAVHAPVAGDEDPDDAAGFGE
jgi:hypothetical protein